VSNASGTVLANPDPFLKQIGMVSDLLPEELPKTYNAIVLLNAALMSREPLSQLVLAISAV
jgi:hypothetical protein